MRRSKALALAFFIAVQGGFGSWVALGGRPTSGEPSVDFATYYLAATALQRGLDVYTLDDAGWSALAAERGVASFAAPYRYPPLLAGLLGSLAGLPFRAALAVWTGLSVGALLVAAAALSRVGGARSLDPPVLIALTVFVPALDTLYTGQANSFALAGASLVLLLRRAGGAALGISLVLKPVAAPLLVLLAWRRDLERIRGVLAGVSAAAVVSLVAAGLAAQVSYLANAWRLSTLALGAPPDISPRNVSLLAALGRIVPADPALAHSIAIAAGAAVVATTIVAARREPHELPRAIAAVLVATLLIAPVVWYHDATLAFVAFVIAWPRALAVGRVALAAAFVLLCADGLIWRALAAALPELSLATLALLALLLVCAFGLRPLRRALP